MEQRHRLRHELQGADAIALDAVDHLAAAPVPAAVPTKPGSCTLPLPGIAADIVDNVGGGPVDTDGSPVSYTVTYSELMDPATIGADDFEIVAASGAGGECRTG